MLLVLCKKTGRLHFNSLSSRLPVVGDWTECPGVILPTIPANFFWVPLQSLHQNGPTGTTADR